MLKLGTFWINFLKSLTLYVSLLAVSFLFVDWFSLGVRQVEYLVRSLFVLPGFIITFPFLSNCWLGSFMNGPGAPSWCPSLYGRIGIMIIVSAIAYALIFAWIAQGNLWRKLIKLLGKIPFGKDIRKQ